MLPGKKYGPQDVVAIFKRRWWLVPGPVVLATFLALIVASKVQDTYQSEMLIQIVPGRVPDRIVPNTVSTRAEDRMESLQALVKSRSELEKLIKEFNLYPRERANLPLTDVIEIMRNAIGVEMVRRNRMLPPDSFYVRYTYRDPALATRVTARLGGLFVDKNAEERIDLADNTTEFLASHLAEAKARLEAQERKLEAFREANAGRLPTQTELNLQALQSAQSQLQSLNEASARDRDQQLMLERLYKEASADPVSVPATAASATDPNAVAVLPAAQQLEVARKNLALLEMRLKPDHPDIRRARRMITDLETQVAAATPPAAAATPTMASTAPALTPEAQNRSERLREMRAQIESLGRQIAFRDREIERVRGVIDEHQRRLEATPGTEREWVALTRDYDTLNGLYQSLLSKSQESAIAGDLEKRRISEQFRVLDPAAVPVRPIGPLRLKINAIGLGLGLFLGLALVALVELLDTSFRTENDVLDVIALPVLALVPLVKTVEDLQRLRRRRWLITAAVAVFAIGGGVTFWSLQLWKHVV